MFEIATTVGETNKAFYFIFAISVFFFAFTNAGMVYFLIRYSRKRNPVATDYIGAKWLEISWTVIPTLLTVGMFYYGWMGFLISTHVPQGATNIIVHAREYNWTFEYPNGKKSQELYVPAGRPINANLESQDVIHGFFIPAFKIKEDVVPGRTNHLSFTALKEGTYDIFCTQYCGVGHSAMRANLVAMRPKDFELWYRSRESQRPVNMAEMLAGSPAQLARGKAVFEANCASCHGLQGQGGLVADARDFQSLQGWKNGSKVAQMFRTVTNGLNKMPSFKDQLSVEDRFATIHYGRHFAAGHPLDAPEDVAALDNEFSLSKGSMAPPEIPISEAMKKIALETWQETGEERAKRPALSDERLAAARAANPEGARLYEANCAVCHGARGEGKISVAALDEVFRSRLLSLALNDPARPWRAGGIEAFHKRIEETSVATGGVKPSFSTLSKAEWEALYRFALALAPPE